MKKLSNLTHVTERINAQLAHYLPAPDSDYPVLQQALAYTVFNGGKRLRPALVYFTGQMFNATLEALDIAATAVEMVHCFSLVHDDLPAMDNSDYRRGKLSCHKQFGEDVAILAGDNLLALAFEILSNTHQGPLPQENRLSLIQTLSQATGAKGMIGGQIMDIKNLAHYSQAQLAKLHRLKTGALIKASMLMGACCSPTALPGKIKQSLSHLAETIGLFYQVCDDILDVIADEKILGKNKGTDQKLGKGTYVQLMGLNGAYDYADQLYHVAAQEIKNFKDNTALASLLDNLYKRLPGKGK